MDKNEKRTCRACNSIFFPTKYAKTNLGARKVHICVMQTARKRSYDWQSSNFTFSFCGTKSQGLDAAYIRNSFPLTTWSNRLSTNRSAALFSGAQARMMLESIRWCTCVYDARKRKKNCIFQTDLLKSINDCVRHIRVKETAAHILGILRSPY